MTVRYLAAACLVFVAACGADEATNSTPAGSIANTANSESSPSTTVVSTATTPPSPPTAPVEPAPTATDTVPDTATDTVPDTTAGITDTSAVAVASCVRVTDFDEPDWVIVNDGVMGGRSVGEGAIVDGVLTFDGTIVTRGGGFSSVRGLVDGELTGATELVMRVRTDGRRYELLADDADSRRQRVTYYRPIVVEEGGWQELSVPLAGMEARVFGTPVDAVPFRPDLATEIGVILADGLDGAFSIEIDWIDACA